MAVISQISVGDIMYYQVDDIPSHTAPRGSVAIMMSSTTYNNGFTYVNNDGGTTWLKCVSSSYGNMYLNGATNTIDFDTQTIGSWYAFNGTPTGAAWTLDPDSTKDWVLATENTTADDLKYTGSTTMRVFIDSSMTLRAGSSKWMSWLTGIAVNFTVPTRWSESFAFDNAATTNQDSNRLLEMKTNDYLLGGLSPVSREAGGGPTARDYIPRHCQIVAVKVDEPLIPSQTTTLINEGFESGNFTASGWTVANNTTNVWVVGTAEKSGGTYSAYVSNNGGTSASYDINTAQASHFYKDFTFPSSQTITLTFDWKCQGENAAGATQYDYGAVVITTTGTTPTAGAEVTTTQTAGAATTRIGATTNLGKFNLAYGTTPGTTWNKESIDLSAYAGETKRLVFTWKNDGSVGTSPPFIVDNIKITSRANNVY